MRRLLCIFRLHSWGQLTSDNAGAFRECSVCGKAKRFGEAGATNWSAYGGYGGGGDAGGGGGGGGGDGI